MTPPSSSGPPLLEPEAPALSVEPEPVVTLPAQAVTASEAPNTKAAARPRRWPGPVPGTARLPRSDGRAAAQNGHAASVARTWRWQDGQGTRGRYMETSRLRIPETPPMRGAQRVARGREVIYR